MLLDDIYNTEKLPTVSIYIALFSKLFLPGV